jgi:hypothetical protein
MTRLASGYGVFKPVKLFFAAVVSTMFAVSELHAQSHAVSSEAAGNYSGEFFGLAGTSGLRNGRNEIPDTIGSKNSEMVLLSTLYVPVSGDITESSTFAVGVEIPYSRRIHTEHGRQQISHTGIGDIVVAGKYGFTLYDESPSRWVPRKAKIDLIGKVKFPTGEDHTTDAQGIELPLHLQLGSGSTDVALGVAFLTETEKYFMIHGHALYWMNTSANNRKMGNAINYEVSFILAALAASVEPVGTFLPKIGVMGMHNSMDEMNGMVMNNSGSDVQALSIGVQSLWSYVQTIGSFWMIDASYQLPIFQRMTGVQPGYMPSFSLGLRIFVK